MTTTTGPSADARLLKQIRNEAKLTQQELSLRMGVSMRTLSRWETGETPLPEGTLQLLDQVLTRPKTAVPRHELSGTSSQDLGLEILDRLKRVDEIEAANKRLRAQVDEYRIKYGEL